MKLLMYFGYANRANTYIIGPSDGGKAIMIDPGCFEVPLLNVIEDNNYCIDSIILTHSQSSHVKGVTTTRKIYNSKVYAAFDIGGNIKTHMVSDMQSHNISGFDVDFFQIPGYSTDRLVFKIENLLFTGNIFNSGDLGTPENTLLHRNIQNEIQKKLLSLDGETIVLPAYGPPSTIQAEREINEKLYNS